VFALATLIAVIGAQGPLPCVSSYSFVVCLSHAGKQHGFGFLAICAPVVFLWVSAPGGGGLGGASHRIASQAGCPRYRLAAPGGGEQVLDGLSLFMLSYVTHSIAPRVFSEMRCPTPSRVRASLCLTVVGGGRLLSLTPCLSVSCLTEIH
jgi:hypothetical protein